MITFADTQWQLLSVALLLLTGLVTLLLMARPMRISPGYAILLYLWHTTFCVVYFLYALSNAADAQSYFLDSLVWNRWPRLGTEAVIYITSFLTQGLGLSYGGTFLFYNILGAIGLLAFAGALREMSQDKARTIRRLIMLIPFLPGLSFWSSAIGKDSIAFLGVGLVCWAAASPYRRAPLFFLAFLALLVVRPHMAGFLIISLAVAFTLSNEGSMRLRLLLSMMVIPLSIAATVISIRYIGLEGNVSSEGVISYVEQRQSYNLSGGSSVDIASLSVPVRLLVYMYRPFFFDAHSLFGVVTSLENLILLLITVMSAWGVIKRRSSLSRFQRISMVLYVLFSWIILANTTANLGIALRQKIMFTPMLLLVMTSYLPRRRQLPAMAPPLPVT